MRGLVAVAFAVGLVGCGGGPGGLAPTSGAVTLTETSEGGGGDTETGGSQTAGSEGSDEGSDETDGDPATLIQTDLAGHSLSARPHFRAVQNFNDDESVEIAVDVERFPMLAGRTCAAWIVEDRGESQWDVDATLIDVRPGGPSMVTLGNTLADSRFEVAPAGALPSDAGAGLGVAYDIVLDCNDNGELDDGDAVDGLKAPGLYRTHDATLPGPLAVSVVEDPGGAFLDQRIFYPTEIESMDAQPLVVVTHGWSYTHTYYDYIGEHLAAYGYIVMLHAADVQDGGPPATIAAGNNTLANTHRLLEEQSTIAGGVLDGHVDATRIMFTGHSTGGEAVVRAATLLRSGAFSSDLFDADDLRVVSSMAPVSWHPRSEVDPGDVPYHMFVAGADDDVSGAPESYYTQPLSIYERATGERQVTYIHGAGHGDLLSCCGELFIDESAPDLIGREETNRVAKGYFLALAELYLRENNAGREFFTRPFADYHPSGIAPTVTVTNEHNVGVGAADVLDDFESEPDLDLSSSGGEVTLDVVDAAEVLLRDNDGSLAWSGEQPSNGMTRARHDGDVARAVVFGWSPDAPRFYELSVAPAMQDFAAHAFLSLRAAQGTRHPETVALGGALSFTLTLRDDEGRSSSLPIDGSLAIPPPYARDGFGAGAGWQNEFSTVRLRIADFAVETDVDLSRIVAVRFEFGEDFGSPRGRIALDDVELVD